MTPRANNIAEAADVAFGWPGAPPSWQRGDKDGVGTAYSAASRLWFTIWNGIITEVYSPTVDKPQIRDLQFLFTDSSSFVEDETGMDKTIAAIDSSLGYRIEGKSRKAHFNYSKEVIGEPHLPCLLVRVKITADENTLKTLKVYVLCAPHLDVSGWGNDARVVQFVGREVLVAQRNGIWLAMGTELPFSKTSVGYVGASDGWTDLHQHCSLHWQFKNAPDGNVALIGEIDLSESAEFTVGLAFGSTQHRALASLIQSHAQPFEQQRRRFVEQWKRAENNLESLDSLSGDNGELYRHSVKLLLAHEDKLYPGALVASLAIPWGEAKDDKEGVGGYHLIWTRDLVQSALGLLAAGKIETPLRALIYLEASQYETGQFAQNFWVDGDAFWSGLQLDEIAFPIVLAHRLWKENATERFHLREMALRAIGFLLTQGPITKQERWEEMSGFSPSTLAVVIAALICAAEFARAFASGDDAHFLEQYADWLERNLENWTVTKNGDLLEGVTTHYVRIMPSEPGQPPPRAGVENAEVTLTGKPPGAPSVFPAKSIVDAGFLELVRYGIRAADDPIVVDTLKVVDSVLKVETDSGTVWRRYNHDGYGQHTDGGPYVGHGQGRAWPLLTGERGHYEIAAGRSAADYIRWMERLATPTHLLPEQSWDEADTPDGALRKGRPTGSAVPLLWAHAEYIKLLRSERDGVVYDQNPLLVERYVKNRPSGPGVTFWSFSCPVDVVAPGDTCRIISETSFQLTFSLDNWASTRQMRSVETRFRVHYVDIAIPSQESSELTFTFYWPEAGRWENKNFSAEIAQP